MTELAKKHGAEAFAAPENDQEDEIEVKNTETDSGSNPTPIVEPKPPTEKTKKLKKTAKRNARKKAEKHAKATKPDFIGPVLPPPPKPIVKRLIKRVRVRKLPPMDPEHYLTHFPKRLDCEICKLCKTQSHPCRKKDAMAPDDTEEMPVEF